MIFTFRAYTLQLLQEPKKQCHSELTIKNGFLKGELINLHTVLWLSISHSPDLLSLRCQTLASSYGEPNTLGACSYYGEYCKFASWKGFTSEHLRMASSRIQGKCPVIPSQHKTTGPSFSTPCSVTPVAWLSVFGKNRSLELSRLDFKVHFWFSTTIDFWKMQYFGVPAFDPLVG